MTAQPLRRTRPVSVTVAVDVDVDVDPEELEAAGWVYVGDDVGMDAARAVDLVRRWHDDTHAGPWQWCRERPCDEVRGRPAG